MTLYDISEWPLFICILKRRLKSVVFGYGKLYSSLLIGNDVFHEDDYESIRNTSVNKI